MIENIIKVLDKYGMLFLTGTGITILYSVVAVLGGALLGILLTSMNRSKIKPLNWIVKTYVEIVRGTPILLQLYFFYFWVPSVLKFINISTFASISMALIFNSAAYVSEIFRAGIEAVDKGQLEAARSLGMSQSEAMRKIVLPQAVKNVLPALGNEFIMMIKETALASTFFAKDIMSVYNIVNGNSFLVIEPLIIVGVIYFVLTFSLSKVVKKFERKLASYD